MSDPELALLSSVSMSKSGRSRRGSPTIAQQPAQALTTARRTIAECGVSVHTGLTYLKAARRSNNGTRLVDWLPRVQHHVTLLEGARVSSFVATLRACGKAVPPLTFVLSSFNCRSR